MFCERQIAEADQNQENARLLQNRQDDSTQFHRSTIQKAAQEVVVARQ
jgi:hypothetical protein